jgi:hypothetical protein
MPIFETREPSAEVQRQLGMANSQLALYARDLKRIVDAECKKTESWPRPMPDCDSWSS